MRVSAFNTHKMPHKHIPYMYTAYTLAHIDRSKHMEHPHKAQWMWPKTDWTIERRRWRQQRHDTLASTYVRVRLPSSININMMSLVWCLSFSQSILLVILFAEPRTIFFICNTISMRVHQLIHIISRYCCWICFQNAKYSIHNFFPYFFFFISQIFINN